MTGTPDAQLRTSQPASLSDVSAEGAIKVLAANGVIPWPVHLKRVSSPYGSAAGHTEAVIDFVSGARVKVADLVARVEGALEDVADGDDDIAVGERVLRALGTVVERKLGADIRWRLVRLGDPGHPRHPLEERGIAETIGRAVRGSLAEDGGAA